MPVPYGRPSTKQRPSASNKSKKITKLKDKEVFAALGWLARENKIEIAPDPADEKEYIVSLVG